MFADKWMFHSSTRGRRHIGGAIRDQDSGGRGRAGGRANGAVARPSYVVVESRGEGMSVGRALRKNKRGFPRSATARAFTRRSAGAKTQRWG